MATEELGVEIFVQGWQKFNAQMEGAEKKVSGFAKTTGKIGSSMQTVGKLALGAMGVVAGALGASGVAIAGLAKESLAMAIDFETSMTGLTVAASATGLSFDELKQAAIGVGGDTRLLGVSAVGAAEAMTGLYKAGLTSTEVFGDLNAYMNEGAELGGALRASIDLAAASELDMVQASDLAAVALSSFGAQLETEEERANFITAAMDNMVKAADASVTSVSGIAEALKMVGPTAGAAGVGLEDVNNAIAILSGRGIEGSMAGTSLNSMLSSLRDTTPGAQEALDQYGITLRDVATGELLPMVDIVGQFENALGDATASERDAALGAIFTSQGLRAMDTLLQEGVTGWNDMADATENAAGIQEQAAAFADTYAGKMEALEGTIETFKIQIGDALLPVATQLLEWFSVMADTYGPQLVGMFEGVSSLVSNFITQLTITDGIWEALAMSFEGTPFEYLQSGFIEISNAVQNVIETVMPYIEMAWGWISQNVQLSDVLIALGIAIATVIIPALYAIIAAAAPVVATFIGVVAIVALLRQAWEANFLGIQEKTQAVMAWIQENVPVIVENVKAFVTSAITMIRAWWASNGDAILAKASAIWNSIAALVTAIITQIQSIVQTVLSVIQIIWQNHGAAITAAAKNIWEMIKSLVEIGIQYVQNTIDMVTAAISGDWETFGAKLRDNASLAWEAIKTIISTAAQNLITILQSAVTGMINAFTSVNWGGIGRAVIQGISGGISSGISSLANAAANAAKSALDAAKGALGIESPSKVFQEVGRQTLAGMVVGMQDMIPQVQATMTAAVSPPRTTAVSPTATPGVQNQVSNQTVNNYNLTTQTTMRPGGLAMEFNTFSLATR